MSGPYLYVGDKCNNNCVFCSEVDLTPSKRPILDIKRELLILRKVSDTVNFMGKEPTLRKDLGEMIRYARKLRFKTIGITTNGRMLSIDGALESLIEDGLSQLVISIHGPDKETHDAQTRVKGSYVQAWKAIHTAVKLPVDLIVNVLVTKITLPSMDRILDLLVKMGVKAVHLLNIAPISRGSFSREMVPKVTDAVLVLTGVIDRFQSGLNIHLIEFPPCTIPEGYRHHFSPCLEDNDAKVRFKECDSCGFECSGVSKGYILLYGDSEFTKVLSPPLSFSIGAPLPLQGALPDLFAVNARIKPAMRISVKDLDELDEVKGWCCRFGLEVKVGERKLLPGKPSRFEEREKNLIPLDSSNPGSIYVYISKTVEDAKKLRDMDPELAVVPTPDSVKKFGLMLGYPDCCVESHVKRHSLKAKDKEKYFVPGQAYPFLANNLLNCVSNHYLSFHYPCSHDCKKSLVYASDILEAIRSLYPRYAEEIERMMRMPCLVWFDPEQGLYPAWDSREGVIFNGVVVGDVIEYQGVSLLKTTHPQKEGIGIDFMLFKKGDRIVFDDDGWKVFKGKEELFSYARKSRFEGVLWNFE